MYQGRVSSAELVFLIPKSPAVSWFLGLSHYFALHYFFKLNVIIYVWCVHSVGHVYVQNLYVTDMD